jgi:hypothetical protein
MSLPKGIHVRFFRAKMEGVLMKNTKFAQTEAENRLQKLDATIRKHTRNTLPEWQVRALIAQIGPDNQHSILAYDDPYDFTAALSARLNDEDGIIVFGSAAFGRSLFRDCYVGILSHTDETAAAVIVHPPKRGRKRTAHIYVPKTLLAEGDEYEG